MKRCNSFLPITFFFSKYVLKSNYMVSRLACFVYEPPNDISVFSSDYFLKIIYLYSMYLKKKPLTSIHICRHNESFNFLNSFEINH